MGDTIEKITQEELQVLRYLLAKIENRHVVISILIDAVLTKYMDNKTHAARALGYSLRAIRSYCNDYMYHTAH